MSVVRKIFRLFLLAMHRGSYIRSRSLVWFVMTIFVPGIICMYWIIAIRQNPELGRSLSTSFMVTYYLTVVTLAALIVSHMKDQIARLHIQQGNLSQHLLRPYSYYFYNIIFEEVPYRLLQGSYGVGMIVLIAFAFPGLLSYTKDPVMWVCALVSMILGFFVCFTLEIVLGLIAFWFYDLRLFHSAYEVLFILLGGWNMPLFLFPERLYQFALVTPFPAVIYVPTLMLSGTITLLDAPWWLIYQLVWLVAIFVTYKVIWFFGIRKFTAAGI
jgi:ABC-2 type transport system permease protein